MRVAVFTKYGTLAASTRYRFQQYEPFLQTNGIEITRQALLENDYLEWKLRKGNFGIRKTFFSFLERCWLVLTIARFDAAVVHCELFPFLPGIAEAWIRFWSVPYIFDFDDAIFHQYDNHRYQWVRLFFGKKIARILKGASVVFAGSEYLAAYSRKYNAKVVSMPTVVDMERYTEKDWGKNQGPFVIGWIGSPSTAEFINEIVPALKAFQQKHSCEIQLIGAGSTPINEISVQKISWKEETEIENLHRFTVGIMPLRESSPWDKGKCAFKLIQYMACGIPVVGSKVGANKDVIHHNVVGFLASTQEEWEEAFEALYRDQKEAQRMGREGRERVKEFYSLQSTRQRWLENLRNLKKV